MKITLISLYNEILNLSILYLSSSLKQAGHDVEILFIPRVSRYQEDDYPEVLNRISELCRDSGLIGISVISHFLFPAIRLTQALKNKRDIPVIWGGAHPTAQPSECLNYADMVCVGEGEEAIVELANALSSGQPYETIPNIWSKKDNRIIQNKPRPPIRDLNSLPFPDLDIMGSHVLDENDFQVLDETVIKKFSTPYIESTLSYTVLGSRGCIYKCSYCTNSLWENLYKNEQFLRHRSIENICSEIESVIQRIPLIQSVNFADDNFTAMPFDRMEYFLNVYKKKIGLPFSCTLSPTFVSKKRLELLMDAGASRITMGVQSASKRMLDLYKRYISVEKTLTATKELEKIRPLMKTQQSIFYHFIVDNPYETAEDKILTFKFLLGLTNRYSAFIHSFTPFPGTELYTSMKKDGLLYDEVKQIYTKKLFDWEGRFTKYWLRLYFRGTPAFLLNQLLKPKLVNFITKGKPAFLFKVIISLLSRLKRLFRGRLGYFQKSH
ncbi:MAG: B12-binding domain-containing radical SAM protein [Proteobacteria bacterium]|nr:B12-binding domain-containing radical SAM protein [Pseudomonadota bacterium]